MQCDQHLELDPWMTGSKGSRFSHASSSLYPERERQSSCANSDIKNVQQCTVRLDLHDDLIDGIPSPWYCQEAERIGTRSDDVSASSPPLAVCSYAIIGDR